MRIAIIGAGIAGLTAARELAKVGHMVVVFEASSQAGGLASGFRDEGWEWPLERFYHHLFTTDKAIRNLAREIGFESKLIFRRQITAQWWDGSPRPLHGGLDAVGFSLGARRMALPVPAIVATALSVIAFPGLPLVDRIRMGAVSAYLKYLVGDWRPLERVTAAEWTRRWMGETVYRQFVFPLLEGKFGPYAEQINMAWLWARLKTRSFLLGYFEGGFQSFVDALLASVRREGAQVELLTPVSTITRLPDGGWSLITSSASSPSDEAVERFDAVISTGSPGLLAKLAPQLPADYIRRVQKLRSLGAVALILALRRPLTDNIYWLNMPKGRFPFLALVEHTNYIESKHYGGDHLIYCGDYLDPSHEYFGLSHEEILQRFLPALKVVNPDFDSSWVRTSWLHREAYAQPIVTVDHSNSLPDVATPLPGLFLASMSQVYPWDRGVNYAVELGQQAARAVSKRG